MIPIIANSITRYCGWETRPRPGADLNGGWHLCKAKIFAKLMQNTPGFRTIEPGDYLQ
jgi:hypothetical protein